MELQNLKIEQAYQPFQLNQYDRLVWICPYRISDQMACTTRGNPANPKEDTFYHIDGHRVEPTMHELVDAEG